MNREDKLRLAQKCRESGAFRPADPSILEQMPVKPVRKFFDTGERKTDTWIFDGTHGKKGQPLFINLHGGGFIKARADRDSVYCSMIADEFQASVWDVDYVLAPEDPFPAAVYESCSIIRYAYMHAGEYGFDRDRIFLLGHSAGANLACGALILNQREPSFRIRGLVLDYIPADQRQNPFTKIKKEDYIKNLNVGDIIYYKDTFYTLIGRAEKDKVVNGSDIKKGELFFNYTQHYKPTSYGDFRISNDNLEHLSNNPNSYVHFDWQTNDAEFKVVNMTLYKQLKEDWANLPTE